MSDDEYYTSKKSKVISINLTPSKYLSSEARYLRAKLTNNELTHSETHLEILHDKYNSNDPLALEVYCNQTPIGYIQKYDSEVDIDGFCFINDEKESSIEIKWDDNQFLLLKKAPEIQRDTLGSNPSSNFEKDNWMLSLWEWADDNDISERYIPRTKQKLLQTKYIDLSEKELYSIPKEIGYMKELTSLALSDNNLTDVPIEIVNLSRLKWLILSDNQLESIPEVILEMSQLQTLSLNNNVLVNISRCIGKLKNLTYLDLSENHLISIPNEIGDCTVLETLNLSKNNLTDIPNEIGDCTSLEILDLNENPLSFIPRKIFNLISLKALKIRQAKIDSLPDDLMNLISLQELECTFNVLNSVISNDAQLLWIYDRSMIINGTVYKIENETDERRKIDIGWGGIIFTWIVLIMVVSSIVS